jgi:hypothetical protein
MFVVKEDLVGSHVSVHDSLDELMYRGRVWAVALHQSLRYVLLVEVTEAVRPWDGAQLTVGQLMINTLPNEWEIVKLNAPISDEVRAKEL